MLDKLTARAGPLINRTSRLPVPPLLAAPNAVVAYKQLAIFGAFSLLGAVLVWPIFGSDYPPGVDTATFLHLSWVTKLAASGQLADPFQDPYWCGGFSYLGGLPSLWLWSGRCPQLRDQIRPYHRVYRGPGPVLWRAGHRHFLAVGGDGPSQVDRRFHGSDGCPLLSGAELHLPMGMVHLGDGIAIRACFHPAPRAVLEKGRLASGGLRRGSHGSVYPHPPHDRPVSWIGPGGLVPLQRRCQGIPLATGGKGIRPYSWA